MKITKSKFVGACHECGEAARNMIEFHWAGQTVRLCDRDMLRPSVSKPETSAKRPKKEIY